MYNCHLDTQPGDLGPFKGCYSVTSTERSFSPRSKKRLETSKQPLNEGSGIFLFELIGINRGMIEKVGQNLSPKVKQVGYRRSNCRWIQIFHKLRGVTSYVFPYINKWPPNYTWLYSQAVSLVESNQTSQSQRVYNVNLCLWISMFFFLNLKFSKLEKVNLTKLYCKGKTKNSDEPKHWQRGWTFKFRWVCNSLIFLEMNELPVQTLLLTLI